MMLTMMASHKHKQRRRKQEAYCIAIIVLKDEHKNIKREKISILFQCVE